jgi:tetratricopeptide (TPR) repeat protein
MGIFVAFVFFALVLYFVLRLYFQEQKPAAFAAICNQYQSEVSDYVGKDNPLEVAEAVSSFASSLDNSELSFYALPKQLETLRPYFEQLWRACHWKDVHLLKELFLQAAIREKTKLVKYAPLDPQAHEELAASYLDLAMHLKKRSDKNKRYIGLAIEEYQIIKELIPNEAWVHQQLATSYHALDMPEKEIEEYEAIVELAPEDIQAELALGKLYFRLGKNGKGLKVYEKLMRLSPDSASTLIEEYGHDPDYRW